MIFHSFFGRKQSSARTAHGEFYVIIKIFSTFIEAAAAVECDRNTHSLTHDRERANIEWKFSDVCVEIACTNTTTKYSSAGHVIGVSDVKWWYLGRFDYNSFGNCDNDYFVKWLSGIYASVRCYTLIMWGGRQTCENEPPWRISNVYFFANNQ